MNAPRNDPTLTQRRRADPDLTIAKLAARQHGVVAREQLLAAGVPAHRIAYRVKSGRLHQLFRGVYRVGPLAVPHEAAMAAVLACGREALLSHRAAAELWQLLPPRSGAIMDVIIRRSCRRPGRGVRVHRVATLRADESTHLDGIPLTTAARTLLDLAGCVEESELERALAHADRLGLADRDDIARLLVQHPRRAGARSLRALVAGEAAALTRSEAEARFLRLVRKAQLPEPEANVGISGFEVDFLWRRERLIVEIDGFAFHSPRIMFESDRRRDAVLAADGLRVMRVTWRQLTTESEAVLARLAQALARAPAR